jgi:histidinol-phosphate phosphatase family protein
VTPLIPPPRVPGSAFDVVFLDRDGTLNSRLPRYVTTPAELELLPGAADAVAELNRSGARVVVVTNQRGLATGELDARQLDEVHHALQERLSHSGAHLDGIFVCPHDHGACGCRKPAPGLFEQALAAAPWADPARCAMVGDMVTDVQPAASLGMRTVLLGSPTSDDDGWERASSLPDAVHRLLATVPARPGWGT